jgi:glucose-1-phosphate cytidylyltransferase
MKAVLFCGRLGTRIREYSEAVPKPMIPLGNQPILWHVMNYYSQYGHRDYLLCLGYKANVIKEFFLESRPHAFPIAWYLVLDPVSRCLVLPKTTGAWH